MTEPVNSAGPGADRAALEREITSSSVVTGYRDARADSATEIAAWQPRLVSADATILRDSAMIRARARDLVRNDPIAKNAVRMNRDAVSGSGLKLALRIDWRTLGMKSLEEAAAWQDHVTREWEAYAESSEFQADARREMTFSQMFALIDQADYVDGESLSVIEMKDGFGLYRTCLNIIDIDRLCNPWGTIETSRFRGGIERDLHGAPLAYHIRNGHPSDVGLNVEAFTSQRVPRETEWGRPIVNHTFDRTRPEQSRGVSEFASIISTMWMLQQYNSTELTSAITQAAFAAVIQTELDWSSAVQVLGASALKNSGGNPISAYAYAHMEQSAEYHKARGITWQGSQIPVLGPNEKLDVVRPSHPNSNFEAFENAFVRKLAAGLGVEAHELGKNYREVNYSAARAALLAVWRTYKARRNRLITQFAMRFFGAWLEEAVAIGSVMLPDGVDDFLVARPYLLKGTFVAWGKPMIDPMKERQAQALGMQMGVETMEDVCAEDGTNWRDRIDQRAFERAYMINLGLDPDGPGPEMPLPPDSGTSGQGADTEDV